MSFFVIDNTQGQQWTTSGNNLLLNVSGNLGLGEVNPSEKLHVRGQIRQGHNLFYYDNINSSINFNSKYIGGALPFQRFTNGYAGSLGFEMAGSGDLTYTNAGFGNGLTNFNLTTRFRITNGGNVAIGNHTPSELLDVNGNLRVRGEVVFGNAINIMNFNGRWNGTSDAKIINGFSSKLYFSASDGSLNYATYPNGNAGTTSSPTMRFFIYNDGRVAIGNGAGTSTCQVPTGYLLGVKGKVICEEVKVKLYANGWPDYVFAKDYKLKPLQEVEKFIENNHHLPEMPSAKELEERQGIEVSEMLTKQQQKIEELTLYLIELKKQITVLENKVIVKQ